MYASVYGDGHIELTYVTAHTNHQPGPSEDAYLPLSTSTREEIALKLANGIPPERIMEGIYHNLLYIAKNFAGQNFRQAQLHVPLHYRNSVK